MMMRGAASFILRLSQSHVRSLCKTEIMIPYNFLTIGERFSNDASLHELLSRMERNPPNRVLIAGCYIGGDDVQFWLRRGVSKLDGIDIYSLASRWGQVVPKLQRAFKTDIQFQQASIEAIPFEGQIFDCVATNAVLEHVRNLGAAISETARVLRRGGWAWHSFGPLYFSFGADHCISAYGTSAGYDHLLLDDEEYQERIRNQEFFNGLADPNLPFWALNNQFSFATAEEYIEHFARHFEIVHVILKISPDALNFRQHYPQKWATLVSSGIAEHDLLIKSMAVVLRKK